MRYSIGAVRTLKHGPGACRGTVHTRVTRIGNGRQLADVVCFCSALDLQ
jgi:hypothetical protein